MSVRSQHTQQGYLRGEPGLVAYPADRPSSGHVPDDALRGTRIEFLAQVLGLGARLGHEPDHIGRHGPPGKPPVYRLEASGLDQRQVTGAGTIAVKQRAQPLVLLEVARKQSTQGGHLILGYRHGDASFSRVSLLRSQRIPSPARTPATIVPVIRSPAVPPSCSGISIPGRAAPSQWPVGFGRAKLPCSESAALSTASWTSSASS